MPAILLTTILTISVLYVPQPLLPVLSQALAVTPEAAALLTTVVFIPLALAPLVYGYLLESISTRRMLQVAVFLLALSSLAACLTSTFAWLMAVRLAQGLVIPALLTAAMTYTSETAGTGDIQRAMAWYIGATIVGGFAGRAMSGIIASLYGWQASFLAVGLCLLLNWVWLLRLPESGVLKLARPDIKVLREVLSDSVSRRVYAIIFCFFLAFAAVMNFIPFRLTELSARADELRIGLAYSGYLMGVLASLNAVSLQRRFGGAERIMFLALCTYGLVLLVLGLPSITVLLVAMFLFCGSMFLTHATATGYLNLRAKGHKGIVNGLYVAFYYAGGVVGSYVPGYAYRSWGWSGFVLVLTAFVLIAIRLSFSLYKGSLAEQNRLNGPADC